MSFLQRIRPIGLTALLCCATVVFLDASGALGQTVAVEGTIVDASNGNAIPFVTVLVESTGEGVAADIDGRFSLEIPDGKQTLRFTSMGYKTVYVDMTPEKASEPLHVELQPAILPFHEIVVSGNSKLIDDPSAPPLKMNSTEDLFDRVPGADFIERANFAWEPVIRGMSGGQLGLVIDDIKVVGACVDKMDPTSAYVEVENLEKLEVSKGGFDLSHASQIGGTVNYVTEKPEFDRGPYSTASAGYESASGLRRTAIVAGMSEGDTSIRGSFAYKKADDFRPGGQDPLPNSGFQKNNFKVDLAQRIGGTNQLTASVLGDNAWDVGYPVLLMDATLAQARIYSLTHDWKPTSGTVTGLQTRIYYNTVDHYMDDYKRDVMQRRVMRGMNMPMYGNTRTGGGISRLDMRKGANQFGIALDVYRTQSFGEMWMFSLFEGIPDMYLLNLGDIVVNHGALSGYWSAPLGARFRTRIDGRFDYSPRDVTNETAIAILQGRWGLDDLSKTYAFGNLSGTLEYLADESTRLRLAAAYVGRLPTHIENYGHYVYNYVDGYFYTGNPNLNYERSSQLELDLEKTTARLGLKASVYANYIQNLIVGSTDAGLVSGSDTYRFRVYTNADQAFMFGGELSGLFELVSDFELAGSLSYTWGQNLDADEPMYMIPPLAAMVSLRFQRKHVFGELETRMAAPQNRVANIVADEDPTDGYFVVNLRGTSQLGRYVKLNAGIENIFDVYYHEHLSLGDLPAIGRNVYVGLTLSI